MLDSAARYGIVASLMTAVFALGGCQSTPPTAMPAGRAPNAAPLRLSAGDTVKLTFAANPDLGTVQTIQPDGTLYLPLVGKVGAAGREIGDLQNELKKRYGDSGVRDADVTVTIQSTAAVVYVTGAVNNQGRVMLNRPMTVFEAIMEVGGFAQGANTRRVKVIRRDGTSFRTMYVDLRGVAGNEALTVDFVQPFDVIVVPQGIF